MKIRTMIVDDSADSRIKLSDLIESNHSIEVVCKIGSNEKDIMPMVEWISPHVIVIRCKICKDRGFNIFDRILKTELPTILTCGEGEQPCKELMELLEKGVLDFFILPGEKKDVLAKVKNAAKARPLIFKNYYPPTVVVNFPDSKEIRKVIVIASSMGGPQALRQVIPRIPENIPASIIIVQHMSKGFTGSLANTLDKISKIRVKEAEGGERLVRGVAYIAPYGFHLFLENSKIVLREGKTRHGVIPSADYTMKSVANSYGQNSIGVVLTGMGKDGSDGVKVIKNKKGRVLVQDKDSSVTFGMPQAALMTGSVDKVVEIERMTEALIKEVI